MCIAGYCLHFSFKYLLTYLLTYLILTHSITRSLYYISTLLSSTLVCGSSTFQMLQIFLRRLSLLRNSASPRAQSSGHVSAITSFILRYFRLRPLSFQIVSSFMVAFLFFPIPIFIDVATSRVCLDGPNLLEGVYRLPSSSLACSSPTTIGLVCACI